MEERWRDGEVKVARRQWNGGKGKAWWAQANCFQLLLLLVRFSSFFYKIKMKYIGDFRRTTKTSEVLPSIQRHQ